MCFSYLFIIFPTPSSYFMETSAMPCQHTIQSSANEHPNGYSTTNTWAGTQNEATKTEARLLDKKCVPWVYVLLRLLKAKNGKSTREDKLDKRCHSDPNVFRITMVWYFNNYITWCLRHVLRYPTSLPIGSSAASALACFRWAIPRVMACFPYVSPGSRWSIRRLWQWQTAEQSSILQSRLAVEGSHNGRRLEHWSTGWMKTITKHWLRLKW